MVSLPQRLPGDRAPEKNQLVPLKPFLLQGKVTPAAGESVLVRYGPNYLTLSNHNPTNLAHHRAGSLLRDQGGLQEQLARLDECRDPGDRSGIPQHLSFGHGELPILLVRAPILIS